MGTTPLCGGRDAFNLKPRFATRPVHIACALSICAIALIVFASHALSSKKAFADRTPARSALSDSVSLRSPAGKSPWVSLNDGREVLIEAELSRAGRNRVQVNRQRMARTSDLLGVVRVSVFSTGWMVTSMAIDFLPGSRPVPS